MNDIELRLKARKYCENCKYLKSMVTSTKPRPICTNFSVILKANTLGFVSCYKPNSYKEGPAIKICKGDYYEQRRKTTNN